MKENRGELAPGLLLSPIITGKIQEPRERMTFVRAGLALPGGSSAATPNKR
jgi:hypothetical protein